MAKPREQPHIGFLPSVVWVARHRKVLRISDPSIEDADFRSELLALDRTERGKARILVQEIRSLEPNLLQQFELEGHRSW